MFCAGHQASRPGHLVLPVTLLHGFQESIFKDKVRPGYPRICNELVYNSLIDGEVTGGVSAPHVGWEEWGLRYEPPSDTISWETIQSK